MSLAVTAEVKELYFKFYVVFVNKMGPGNMIHLDRKRFKSPFLMDSIRALFCYRDVRTYIS